MNFYTFFDLIALKLLTARDNFKLVGFFFKVKKKLKLLEKCEGN